MKLYLGSDAGSSLAELQNSDIYCLELGTFILFSEIFEEQIIENIFNLKGQYELILFRNYEINFPISQDKIAILRKLKSLPKAKLEQSVSLIISESVIKLLKFNKKIYLNLIVNFTNFHAQG